MKNNYVKDLASANDGDQIEMYAWLASKRERSNIVFLDIQDSTGTVQMVVDKFLVGEQILKKSKKVSLESAVRVLGRVEVNGEKREVKVLDLEIDSAADFSNILRPRDKRFDPFAEQNSSFLTIHPEIYLRNPKLAAALKLKSKFRHNASVYLWQNGFTQIETPTLTTQTLYGDSGAFWIDVNRQKLSLSRCATFHLEPALMAYEKVFCIADSHSKEKSRSDRHLVEYTHLKAELAWVNLEELMELAGQVYFQVAKKTFEEHPEELENLGISEFLQKKKLEKLDPSNYRVITYDEAVKLLSDKGFEFEYGRNLSTRAEQVITSQLDQQFVWIKYPPCTAEAFLFKRNPHDSRLTMAADLIAPEGYGEIFGAAEKITETSELLERMKEKNKLEGDQAERYSNYINLRTTGLPRHGGIGMGMERAVRYLLNIPHIKFTRPYPILHGTRVHH